MSGDVLISDCLLFDGSSDELNEVDIQIVNGRIEEIGPNLKVREGVHHLPARGSVVTPGFIDNHFHAYGISLDMLEMEASPTSFVALKARHRLERALNRGFTTVRDVAGGDIGLSKALSSGLIRGPRYFFTGPALSQTGGHGDVRRADFETCCLGRHSVEVVDGVEPLRVAVRNRLRTGAHAIKIMTSGGVVSLTDPIHQSQYSAEEIQAVVDEARRRETYVCAHAYSPQAILHSIRNGVSCIEHGNLLDRPTAREMVKLGAVLDPTLATYVAMNIHGESMGMDPIARDKNSKVLSAGKTAVEIAMDEGIPVGFGTDLMGDLEELQLTGLAIQHEVQGSLELLRSVTSVNADILGHADVGRLAEGKFGDLLIFPDDPFQRPEVLWDASRRPQVILAGELVA